MPPRLHAPRGGLARAGLVVGPATAVANALGYAFNAVVARGLGPDGYGALGALLALVLIGSVPALAVQAVVARRTALAADDQAGAVARHLLGRALRVGLLTAAAAAALAPLVSAYLRLDSPAAALWLAVSLLPLVLVSALQGVLQGRELFARLAGVFVAAAGLRLLGGAGALLLDGGVAAVLAGTAVGGALAALLALDQVRRGVSLRGGSSAPVRLRGELGSSTAALLGLVVLANVDVLLARRHLPPVDAGLYAVGAVFAKVAFWAPQVVVVVVFPRLTGVGSGRVLRAAVALVAACGAVLVAGTALLAGPLVDLVFGPAYGRLAGDAWLFTAVGGCLAVVQLLVFRGIAQASSRLVGLLVLAAAVEVALISTVLGDTLRQVVTTALGTAALLVLLGLVLLRRTRDPADGLS